MNLTPDAWSLRAEIASHTQDLAAALEILQQGLCIHPDSKNLAENHALVKAELKKKA